MSRSYTITLSKITSGVKTPDTGRTVTLRQNGATGTVLGTATETPANSGQYALTLAETPYYAFWAVDGTLKSGYSFGQPFWVGAYDSISGAGVTANTVVSNGTVKGLTLTGTTISAGNLYLGAASINTAGTLTNVAYKNQPNSFAYPQSVDQSGTAVLYLHETAGERFTRLEQHAAGELRIASGSQGSSTAASSVKIYEGSLTGLSISSTTITGVSIKAISIYGTSEELLSGLRMGESLTATKVGGNIGLILEEQTSGEKWRVFDDSSSVFSFDFSSDGSTFNRKPLKLNPAGGIWDVGVSGVLTAGTVHANSYKSGTETGIDQTISIVDISGTHQLVFTKGILTSYTLV